MTEHYIPFLLSGETFLVGARLVKEILGRKECTLVPHATAAVTGVFPWNGCAVAMIELPRLLSIDTQRDGADVGQRTLLLQWEQDVYGIRADAVQEPVKIDPERLKPVHAADSRFTQAEVEWSEGSVARVLDVSEILRVCFQGS